ncbi:hypothetical protein [Carboxylicivirga taeanensis]|uniref:hypothetical protein n=1 Tax=Carboxylicivirga taeanensis TaxID=1416875 RepID=UPI003F6E1C7F
MRYIQILTVCIAVAILGKNGVAAQEKINQDVKVVKEYNPTISDAYKVNYMPVLADSTTFNPRFNYRIISTSVTTDYQPAPIAPARINASRKEYLHKSFIKGGVGNYSTLLAGLGFNVLANEKFVLGLNANHVSSLGNITLEDDNTVDAPFHDTDVKANFKHFFDDKTLRVDMAFVHNVFQYYGYQTLTADGAYWLPDGTLTSGAGFIPDADQRFSNFTTSIGLSNNETDDGKMQYDTEAGFSAFGNLTGVSQLGFKVGGQLYQPINNLGFNLEGGIESYKTSVPDSIGPMYSFNDRSQLLLRLNPSLNFNFDRAKLKVGIQIAGLIDTEADKFYLTPDVMGEFTVVEGIATIYGGVNGRVRANDYTSMLNENAFASADINVRSSVVGLNLLAGIKGNFSASTSFSAGLEYGIFNDEHFWVNKTYATHTLAADAVSAEHYSNQFDVVYDDGALLTVKGALLYKPKQTMEFLFSGAYYGWNLDSEQKAWHQPEVELGIESHLNVIDNLYASAGIKYLGERWAYDVTHESQIKELEGVVDVNVGAEYYFSKQWSFWASMNNIAVAKYYQWNGYPMQGLNARAGIIFSF